MSEFQTVAMVEDIVTNSSVSLEVNGVELLVCNADGNFFAVENRCSHQNRPLTGGRIRGGYLMCPVHGMRFKLETGDPVGQLSKLPIKTFATRVSDGELQVSVPLPKSG